MTEEQIKAYLASIDFDETHILPMEFGLDVVEELTADLIKQVEVTKQ
jgi:hypothetical protein